MSTTTLIRMTLNSLQCMIFLANVSTHYYVLFHLSKYIVHKFNIILRTQNLVTPWYDFILFYGYLQ